MGVGVGPDTGNQRHALLWSGSAASAIDLNPSGFLTSEGLGISAGRQVGTGRGSVATGNQDHALLWVGTAASVVDLHAFLPSPLDWDGSGALSIDSDGNIAGVARNSFTHETHAFLWLAPEPAALELSSAAVACLALMRSRRAVNGANSSGRDAARGG